MAPVLLAAALVLLLAAQAGAAALRVGYVQSNASTQVLRDVVRAFEERAGANLVELVPFSNGEAQRMLPQWLLTGEKADIFYLSYDLIAWLKNQDLMLYLDGFRWQSVLEALKAFPPGMIAAVEDARGLVGVPMTADVDVLQYNETLLAQYGIPPLRQFGQDWTWREFVDIGRRVADPDRGQYFLHLDLEMVAVYFLVHGQVTSPDGRSAVINQSPNPEFLELVQNAIHRDRISPPPSRQQDTTRHFRERRLALRNSAITGLLPPALAQSNWMLNAGFTWDVVPYPLSPFNFQRPGLGSGNALVVAQGALLSPEMVSFLAFAASPQGQEAVARSGRALPALWQLWPELVNTAGGPPQNTVAFYQAVQSWQHFAFPQVPPQQVERLAAPLAAVMEGALSPTAALAQMQRLLDEILRNL